MKESLSQQTANLKHKNNRHKRWKGIVSILACMVVFCTVYALILPALTAEGTPHCGKEEHTHTEDCYEKKLICGKEEGEGAHHHTDECYREEPVLVCTTPESDGHQHTDDCYTEEQVLTCTNTDPDHVHNDIDGCYTTERKLTCGKEEGEGAHHHTEECYETKRELICGQEENDGHKHTDDCYKKELVCGKEEHKHILACYSDPNADVEDGNVWQRTVSSVTLTGNWGADLAAIAKTQSGYTESTANYAVAEDGQTIHGYTRYGAWANDPYRDNWSAQFADFCLSYAGVPTSAVPQNSDCSAWNYTIPDGYTPKTGDLLLLDTDSNGSADHAGIVTSVSDSTLTAIVGDADKAVRNNTYNIGSETIKGYVSIPENPALATPTPEPTKEPEATPEAQPTQEPEATPAVTEEPTQKPENKADDVADDKADENKDQDEDVKEDDGKKDDTANNIEVTPTPEVTETPIPSCTPEITSTPGSDIENPMESDDTSWCTIKILRDIDTNDEETADDIEVKPKNRIMRYAARAINSLSLDDYITSISLLKLNNGEWVKIDENNPLKEGDKVKVDIAYEVQGGLPSGVKELTYQIPANIKLEAEMTGSVMQDGIAIGKYVIGTDGQIVITLDDNVKTDATLVGDIGFKGTAMVIGSGNKEDFTFPGTSETITIEKEKTPFDLTTKKEATLSDDYKTIDYTITVSSNLGTDGNKVTIIDKFSDSYTGKNATGTYQQNSFKLVKVNKDGNPTKINSQPVISEENGRQTFTYKDLDPLGEGEKYIVTYKADVKEHSSGGGTLANNAGGVAGSKNNWSWSSTKIPHGMIAKTGSYDSGKKEITWTITLNEDSSADMSGYTLKDQLPSNSDLISGSIKIDPALPNNATVDNFPIVFPENSGKKKYVITYKTKAPDVSDGNSVNVNNTASIEKGNESYGTGSEVPVKPHEEGINKYYSYSDTDLSGKTKYTWGSELSLPERDLDEIVYEDTIQNTLDANKNIVTKEDGTNPHYGIASEIASQLKTGDNIQLRLEDGTSINYDTAVKQGYQISFEFYTDETKSSRIEENDSKTHVGYYIVRVVKNNAEKFKALSLKLIYSTYVDYGEMPEGSRWTFYNKGQYNHNVKVATHTYEKPPVLLKQTGVNNNGNITYQNGNLNVDYNVANGYLYYRLLINTTKDQNSDIEITDTLLDEGMEFAKDDDGNVNVNVNFYSPWSSYGDNGNNWKAESKWFDNDRGTLTYDLAGNKKPEVSIDGKNLKVVIKSGYNDFTNAPYCFSIAYKVKISDDPYWKDLTHISKAYGNSAKYGETKSETITTVGNREVKEVKKKGKQRTAIVDGKEVLLDIVDYTVTINPTGKDLIPNSDTIELKDVLSGLTNQVKAYLEIDSIKLYKYDPNAEEDNYKGQEVDRSEYTVQYDDTNSGQRTMILTISDSTPYVLQYTYSFERGKQSSPTVTNNVSLSGQYSDDQSLQIKEDDSYANLHTGSLMVYKVDKDDYSVRLGKAKFTLEEYNVDSKEFTRVDLDLAQEGGTKENSGTDTVYVTNADGYLKFDGYLGSNKQSKLKLDTIYRLTELEAPVGYKVCLVPNYFVLKSKDKTDNDFQTLMDSATSQIKGNVYYFEAKNNVSINVPNEFAGITVRKVWEDSDGNVIRNPGNLTANIELYRYNAERQECTVQMLLTRYYQKKSESKWNPELGRNEITYKDTDPLWMVSAKSEIKYVKSGSTVTLKIQKNPNDSSNYNNAMNYALQALGWSAGYIENGAMTWKKEEVIVDNTQININLTKEMLAQYGYDGIPDGSWLDGNTTLSIEGITSETYAPGKDGTKIDEIELSARNNWSYTWDNLPDVDDDGKPYYYELRETSATGNYKLVGCINGQNIRLGDNETVFTNRQDANSYVLPETGGIGTNRFTAVGLALMAGSLMCGYVMRRKRRERRGN